MLGTMEKGDVGDTLEVQGKSEVGRRGRTSVRVIAVTGLSLARAKGRAGPPMNWVALAICTARTPQGRPPSEGRYWS